VRIVRNLSRHSCCGIVAGRSRLSTSAAEIDHLAISDIFNKEWNLEVDITPPVDQGSTTSAGPVSLTTSKIGVVARTTNNRKVSERFVPAKEGEPVTHYYEGELLNGIPHGMGTVEGKGIRYVGHFNDGKRDGHGIRTGESGFYYDGQYLNNQPTGMGIMRMAFNNAVYDGEFAHGARKGWGTWTAAFGKTGMKDSSQRNVKAPKDASNNTDAEPRSEVHVAQLAESHEQLEPTGTVADNVDKVGEGLFGNAHQQDEAVEAADSDAEAEAANVACQEYSGEWDNDMRHGYGQVVRGTGRFVGEWQKDYPHGKGRFEFGDGSTWLGTWNRGKLTRDPSVVTLADGSVYRMAVEPRLKWSALFGNHGNVFQCLHGSGSIEVTRATGETTVYQGQIRGSLRHGQGVLSLYNGLEGRVVFDGRWEINVPIISQKRVEAAAADPANVKVAQDGAKWVFLGVHSICVVASVTLLDGTVISGLFWNKVGTHVDMVKNSSTLLKGRARIFNKDGTLRYMGKVYGGARPSRRGNGAAKQPAADILDQNARLEY
jgi:hypothetical protein